MDWGQKKRGGWNTGCAEVVQEQSEPNGRQNHKDHPIVTPSQKLVNALQAEGVRLH